MSNVVDLLERMGRSSRLKSLTSEQLAQELAQAGIEPAVQSAIVQQRPRQLEEYLAWAWALKHAEVELTPWVWGEIAWRIRSYTNDRRYKPIPELHSLLAEAERNADVRD